MSSLSTTSSPHLTTFFARKRSVNDGGPVPALPASLACGLLSRRAACVGNDQCPQRWVAKEEVFRKLCGNDQIRQGTYRSWRMCTPHNLSCGRCRRCKWPMLHETIPASCSPAQKLVRSNPRGFKRQFLPRRLPRLAPREGTQTSTLPVILPNPRINRGGAAVVGCSRILSPLPRFVSCGPKRFSMPIRTP